MNLPGKICGTNIQSPSKQAAETPSSGICVVPVPDMVGMSVSPIE